MTSGPKIIVVGSGIFGATAARTLNQRGAQVRLLDAGPIPHPEASSTDISKLIRMDYGNDVFYAELMERALEGWRVWNKQFDRPLFHEVGALMLTKHPMQTGQFEADSFKVLKSRGHQLKRLNSTIVASEFPNWNANIYVDGYCNPQSGWAESGAVTQAVVSWAEAEGVEVLPNCKFESFIEKNGRVIGLRLEDGTELHADHLVLSAGAWTPFILPELSDELSVVGQPVIHFVPSDVSLFRPPGFLPWAADIANTGWYGFPVNAQGILKIANHGPGISLNPNTDSKSLYEAAEDQARAFFAESIPKAAELPFAGGRLCMYCDSFDGDFFIDHHPQRPGLFVATGGSGHGFKFAPMLGDIIADVLLGKPNPWASRFAWRKRTSTKVEQARFSG